jgi:hypothetical protein
MWAKLIAILASLAADPAAIDREMPRSCGAVAVAYAATAQDKAPEPKPVPPKPAPAVCEQCGGKGFITHGDGHRTPCPNCKGKG